MTCYFVLLGVLGLRESGKAGKRQELAVALRAYLRFYLIPESDVDVLFSVRTNSYFVSIFHVRSCLYPFELDDYQDIYLVALVVQL
ncbi:hypothetical protein CMEL01_16648 [Colletotrichum melonis]|uniref:Uncharacterized protein n=1 Tax=Colletotrichum melonis TaxID=1209925 RepID=A0AAI9XN41_9PEZI|nr:hypothetical protein CMEL01_16648 [Colletotrichum melonis]